MTVKFNCAIYMCYLSHVTLLGAIHVMYLLAFPTGASSLLCSLPRAQRHHYPSRLNTCLLFRLVQYLKLVPLAPLGRSQSRIVRKRKEHAAAQPGGSERRDGAVENVHQRSKAALYSTGEHLLTNGHRR